MHNFENTSAFDHSFRCHNDGIEVAEHIKPVFQRLRWKKPNLLPFHDCWPIMFCSHTWMIAVCAVLIFCLAAVTSKNTARSNSGNFWYRPDAQRQSLLRVLLMRLPGSPSRWNAQA